MSVGALAMDLLYLVAVLLPVLVIIMVRVFFRRYRVERARFLARVQAAVEGREVWAHDQISDCLRGPLRLCCQTDPDDARLAAALDAWRASAEALELHPGLLRPGDDLIILGDETGGVEDEMWHYLCSLDPPPDEPDQEPYFQYLNEGRETVLSLALRCAAPVGRTVKG